MSMFCGLEKEAALPRAMGMCFGLSSASEAALPKAMGLGGRSWRRGEKMELQSPTWIGALHGTRAPSGQRGEETCPICLESPERPIALPCGHAHCADCLLQAVARHQCRSCPVCRGALYASRGSSEELDEQSDSGRDRRTVSCVLCDWFLYFHCSRLMSD